MREFKKSEMKKIKVTCSGAGFLKIHELINFQGNLKKISKNNLDKLKKRIKKDGINSPFFIWEYKKINYILDGHQRLKALLSLQNEGYNIPSVPVAYIEAKNKKDAKQKLLGINSQFGDFNLEDFKEWTGNIEENFKETIRILDNQTLFDVKEKNKEIEKNIPSLFQIIIDCKNEEKQKEFYNKLTKEGYECQVLIL
jgi:hypothetical protein